MANTSSDSSNMIVHLIAGGLAGTTGAILTSPLEVVKVRFQADQKSLKRRGLYTHYHYKTTKSSVPNATTTPSTTSSSSMATSATAAASSSTSSSSAASSSSSSPRNKAHHHHNKNHHPHSNAKWSGIRSYVNILFRNNHGGTTTYHHHHHNHHHHPPTASSHFLSNGINFELNQSSSSHFNSSSGFQPVNVQERYQKSQIGRNILFKFRSIIENEGFRALYKGLGPNIIGVAPYRAIYFFSYANSKNLLLKQMGEEGPLLHIGSAFMAGFAAVTITNPIWFVKTRLQVDETRRGTSALEVINKILREKGPLGFYKGISASYFGITESALYFVIYEKLKSISFANQENKDCLPLSCYLTSAGFSKTLASCICYPHEVARTRLRLEGNKYRSFFQTLNLIIVEEGVRGMYKGMATHLIRQIPNTAIVMTTYELIINYWKSTHPTTSTTSRSTTNSCPNSKRYEFFDDDDSN